MTVQQLITKLQDMPLDRTVKIYDDGRQIDFEDVEKPDFPENAIVFIVMNGTPPGCEPPGYWDD